MGRRTTSRAFGKPVKSSVQRNKPCPGRAFYRRHCTPLSHCHFTRRTATPGKQRCRDGGWRWTAPGAGPGCGCRQRVYPARVGGLVEARGPRAVTLRAGPIGRRPGGGAAGRGGPGSGSSEVRWRAGRAPKARRRRFWLPCQPWSG